MEEDQSKKLDDQSKSVAPLSDEDQLRIEGNTNEDPTGNEWGYFDEVGNTKYFEETSAEIAAPHPNRAKDSILQADRDRPDDTNGVGFGTIAGSIALIVSILSLFMMPFLLGIIGIIGGFISRRQGAKSLGSWAIGIGVVSIIIAIFILPFF